MCFKTKMGLPAQLTFENGYGSHVPGKDETSELLQFFHSVRGMTELLNDRSMLG